MGVQAVLNRPGRGLRAAVKIELAKDMTDVYFNRPFGNEEAARNRGVAEAIGDQREHFALSLGECASGRHAATDSLQRLSRRVDVGFGAEALEDRERPQELGPRGCAVPRLASPQQAHAQIMPDQGFLIRLRE